MAEPTKPISRFPVPAPETLPTDIREVVDANTAKAGFSPNVFLAYGYKPEQIDLVLLTHAHLDHVLGLAGLLATLALYRVGGAVEIIGSADDEEFEDVDEDDDESEEEDDVE